VERLAGKLAEILNQLALATCATTMTNPGKVGHLPQTKPHTAKASDAVQTLRGI
jgi:hypothetical protein